MQYQSECLSALKSVANIQKPFEKTFMDTMKLFMAIPDRINFLQLGRYGCFSEQTYRNLFEHETFDWFAFNGSIISKHLTGKRKAIAIDPSYIPKSGKKTPWIGYFWSGCAGEYKRGLEIMGIGVIDIDNHECMTLGSIQTPDCKTLDNMDKNLVDWYSSYLISRKDKLQSLSRTVVADAFFSKETFITPMCENDFHVISRFRNDVILYYPTLEQKTGKRGHPKWFDGRIDFANLDLTRCKEYEVNKGKLYGLRVYAKAFKRYVSLAVPLISECGVFCLQATVQKDTIFRPFHAVLLYTAIVIAIVVRDELLCFFVQGKEHFGVAHGISVLLSVMSQREKVVVVDAANQFNVDGHISTVRVVDFGCLQSQQCAENLRRLSVKCFHISKGFTFDNREGALIGSSFICGGYILFCNHPLSNNRNAGCCPAVDFGCCFLYLVSLGKVCGLCRLLNPQIIVYSLQFRFGLALGNEHLFRKHCIYHLYDFVFTRQPYLLCQFSADISDMVFQRLHLGCS